MFSPSVQHAKTLARDWLLAFSSAVRARDYAAGHALFAPHVVAFGTFSPALCGLADLEANQWRHIWENTCDFEFDFASLMCGGCDDFLWIAVRWSSHALDSNSQKTRFRTGRATFALEKIEGKWLAVHSHHSLDPERENFRKTEMKR